MKDPLFTIYERCVATSRATRSTPRDYEEHEAVELEALEVMLDLEKPEPKRLDGVLRALDDANWLISAAWRSWLAAVAGQYPKLLQEDVSLVLYARGWRTETQPLRWLINVDNALGRITSASGITGLSDLQQAVRALYARLDWDERHACRACGEEVDGNTTDHAVLCSACGAINVLEAEGGYGDDGRQSEWWTVRVVAQEVAK